MLPSARMTARQAAAREIVHPELGANGRLFTPLPGAFTSTPSSLVNLCPNGSFEYDTLGAAVAGWTKNSGSTNMTAHGTLPTGAIGTHAANFGSGSSEIWQYQQTVASPVTAGVAYTVSALFIQNASNATGFRLQIQWLNASNAVISTTSGSFTGNPGNGSSGTVSVAGTAPGGAVTARILIDHNVADINTCNIDAINFAPTAQGTAYHDGDTAAWLWSGTAGNSSSGGQPTNPQPTGVSKYGQAGWAYDITEAFFDNGVQTQDWDLARVLRNSGLFAESDGGVVVVHVFAPTDIATLKGWWDFSQLALANNAPISTLPDLSGRGFDFVQATGANQPLFQTNVQNGHGVGVFDGAASFLSTGDVMAGCTAGEIFIVIKVTADPNATASKTGLWKWDPTPGALSCHHPWTDGIIYEAWGTSVRNTAVDPPTTMAAWRVYNVSSAPGSYIVDLDGTDIFTTATNTVAFGTAPVIGRSTDGSNIYFLDGMIGEIVVSSAILGSTDRANLLGNFRTKWGTP